MTLCFSAPLALRGVSKQHACSSSALCRVRMEAGEETQDFRGFGDKPVKRAKSRAAKRRDAAAERYDKMAAAGMPEYSVWVRLKEAPRPPGMEDDPDFPPMPWLPAGSLSVPRSSQVSSAIFDAEEDLLQGIYRLYPNMKKEPLDNIEYGFQLKQFTDEEIRTAERPVEGGVQGMLRGFFGKWQNPLNPGDQ